MKNKHIGSSLQSFYEELGEWEAVKAGAEKKIKTMKELVEGPPLLCPICERPNYRPSDHHMVPRSRGGKSTETICCDCHRAIHSSFSNKELEETFHTVEALLTNETFAKMIKFISKQDPGGRVSTKKSKERLKKK